MRKGALNIFFTKTSIPPYACNLLNTYNDPLHASKKLKISYPYISKGSKFRLSYDGLKSEIMSPRFLTNYLD